MRRYGEPSKDQERLLPLQFCSDCITAMRGYDFREGHRFGLGLRTITQLFAIVKRAASRTDRMIFKIIAFLAAAIPIFLFVRSIFFRRTTRINEGLREFKKQANLAVSIFLFLIVCVVVFAAGKLAWTWWSSL
jgi:hypothetical protein